VITGAGVSYEYGTDFRLQGISFAMETGSFWGIIGPNGSGKSTLLRLISGLIHPHSGYLRIDGRDVGSIPSRALAREMAVVGSDTQFVFPYRVREVVLMGRIPRAGRFGGFTANDRKKVEESLEKTEALEFLNRYVHQLSSGERQRVLLARALAQEPQILLLDEPTAHMDLHYEIQIFRILRMLNETYGKTIITVSHHLNLVSEFCRSILLLKDGRVFCSGSSQDVFTPETLRDVFRIDCRIVENPFSRAPSVQLDTR
jgi:iron complex transport system ATP-binding protein